MKLQGVKTDCYVKAILIAADVAGVLVTVTAPNDLNVVALETPKGSIYGSESVLRYIARTRPEKDLYGKDFHEHSTVDSMVEYIGATKARETMKAHLAQVNKCVFNTSTFCAGDRFTIADIIAFTYYCEHTKAEDCDDIPHVTRWFNTIANMPQVKTVMGSVVSLPSKAVVDATIPASLDTLPPSPFNLDAWKRHFSNSKDLYNDAMKYFWENLDANGWSLWHMKYDKLDDECKVAFVTSNQLNGFIQRTDPNFRKYAFGNCAVIGDAGNFDITGVWLFRGTEMPPQMLDHPSYEYHTFRKLDHTNEADKKLVADYWCNENEVEGRKISDSKVYK